MFIGSLIVGWAKVYPSFKQDKISFNPYVKK